MSDSGDKSKAVTIEAVFQEALALEAADRSEFLDRVCPDAEFRARIEVLLAAHDQESGFLPGGDSIETVASDVSASEETGMLIGRYKLLEKLGEGGFGSVWAAEQREPVKRRVALKIIKLGMDTKQVVARFEAERQALALMDHPNIAKVLDAGTTDTGRPYFVMELVKGIPITKYFEQEGTKVREKLGLFIRVCQAIQHAHQKGIIHRDIKPSNVMVTLHDGEPVPKVIDFGIAKATQGELTDKTIYTQYSQFIGTPAYMSPEQAEMSGLDVDTRSDIYSLGVLLYEILTGSTPFDSRELMASGIDEMRKIIRERDPIKPSTRLSESLGEDRSGRRQDLRLGSVESDLDWIVMKCLEKDRARRYETANGLAADIGRHLRYEPVVACPPSPVYRFKKVWQRNRTVTLAVVVMVGCLLTALASLSWALVRERLGRITEQTLRQQAEQHRVEAEENATESEQNELYARRLLYASDMNLAQQAMNSNNIGQARRLLDRHRPLAGDEDLRAWEWRYLWRETRGDEWKSIERSGVRGWDVGVAPDGNHVVVAWSDGKIDLWNISKEEIVRSYPAERRRPEVCFSPLENVIAIGSRAGQVNLFDLNANEERVLWSSPSGESYSVHRINFSLDGESLVILASDASRQKTADIWVVDVASGKTEYRVPTESFAVNSHLDDARLSADRRRVIFSRWKRDSGRSSMNSLFVRSVELEGRQIQWETRLPDDTGVGSLAVSPDGRHLAVAVGFQESLIQILNAETGELEREIEAHEGWVCRLEFNRDGSEMISASTDQTIRFWDTRTWEEKRLLSGHTDEVHSVAVSASGSLVASVSKDGMAKFWRPDKIEKEAAYLSLSDPSGKLLAYKDSLLARIDKQNVTLVDLERELHLEQSLLVEDAEKMEIVDASLDEVTGALHIVTWSREKGLVISELVGREFVEKASIKPNQPVKPELVHYRADVACLAWTDDARSSPVNFVNLARSKNPVVFESPLHDWRRILISPSGRLLVLVTERGVCVWNTIDQKVILQSDCSPSYVGRYIHAFLDAEKFFAIASEAEGNRPVVDLFDLSNPGEDSTVFQFKENVSDFEVTKDQKLLVVSTMGGLIQVIDPSRREPIAHFYGHLNGVRGVAFSPDGERLISSSNGREAVKIWDFDTRQEMLTLKGLGSRLRKSFWSSDGNAIVVGKPWQVWRAPSWEAIEKWESSENSAAAD